MHLKYLLLIALLMATHTVMGQEQNTRYHFQIENDAFGWGDEYYTNGLQLGVASTDPTIPWRWLGGRLASDSVFVAARASLGQLIYTPRDISSPLLNPLDRPYSGVLYLTSGVRVSQLRYFESTAMFGPERRVHEFDVTLGVMGPASQSDHVQTIWHRIISAQKPEGWSHQLDNRFVAQAHYAWTEITSQLALPRGARTDAHLRGFAHGGNLHNRVGGELGLRLGRLSSTHDLTGSIPIRPIDPTFIGETARRGAFLFSRARMTYVATNETIEAGLPWRVTPTRWVGEVHGGVALPISEVAITFQIVARSPEIQGGGWHRYWSFGLSI